VNYKEQYQKTVESFAESAMNPAFIDNARHMVKELEKKYPEVYAGLGAAVAEQLKLLKERKKDGESND
jgi:translation initiation factor 2 alpha subunit (eIF-2alpha)